MNLIEETKTVYPSLSDLYDLNKYLNKLSLLYSKNFGMIKIQPPKNWKRPKDYKSLENKII